MYQQKASHNYLKNKVICYLGGPILFTAPHSKKLSRGGPKYNEKQRIHQRELYTAWMAAKLAELTSLGKKQGMNSFCVWGKSSALNDRDMDPNYLLEDMLAGSEFHQSLHSWALLNQGRPILHVDMHGKMNRDKNCEVDVGYMAMQALWEEDPLLGKFQPFFEKKMAKLFEGLKFRTFTCKFNTDPYLHGYWGAGMMTMTEQAIRLGIPSFQLQIPLQVRKALFKKPDLMKAFADCIVEFYTTVIVPYDQQKKNRLRISKQIGEKLVPTLTSSKEAAEAVAQIQKMEEKYELDLNSKQI